MRSYTVKLILAVAVVSSVLFITNKWTREGEIRILKSVQNKEMVLNCDFYTGYRTVPSESVVDYMDGRFYFTKGSATACYLTPVGDTVKEISGIKLEMFFW